MKYPLEKSETNGKKNWEEKYRVLREKEQNAHTLSLQLTL
jgi:hypothetical protein